MNRDLTYLVIGGIVLYLFLKNQLPKVTDPAAQAIADFWVRLTQAPPIQVAGNVVFPDGATVALSTLTLRTDADHNVFTQANGHVYQLQPHNADGNWPAVLVQ